MLTQNELKELAAKEALKLVKENEIIGIGSGSTVNIFIKLLATLPFKIKGAVTASEESSRNLRALGFEVYDANQVDHLRIYVDGADEITPEGYMTKGGGAALTREKILASLAGQFICIVDETKLVDTLGTKFALPVEVIPMAREKVLRDLAALGGKPLVRDVITDNQCQIIDVKDFLIPDPLATEKQLNNIPGVVTNGIFAQNKANFVIIAKAAGIETRDLG